ncbi:ABC transporter ATP-binding protein [Ruminococcus sp. Marseille-P6503]|uniref:ABC transporter ATP-binding protein n=1 Tax=Ruminococcus sp. Marseille-P6503 TaxID=2364796 RepID=UPI000F52C259|nr:ABC transporter ATP-binding protein [Ruminococcus sp. Marseille-P6503]
MLKLFKYLRNYKLQSIVGPLFKLIEACFELAVPLVMAKIIDVGIAGSDKRYIITMGGVLVLLGVLGLVCSLTAQYFAAKAALGFGTELRRDLYRHINTLSHSEIDKIGSSTLVTRMTVDINQAQTGVNMLLRLFLRSPFIVIGSIIMAFTISVKLTLIFLIAAPVLGLVIYLVMTKTVPMFKTIQRKLDRTTLTVNENLAGVRVIRAFSRQKNEEKEFHDNADELFKLQIRAGKISALMNPCTYVIVYAAIIAIIWFGGIDVNIGGITQGELIALTSYMNQILLALLAVAVLVTSITKAQASSIRINEVFGYDPTVTDENTQTLPPKENSPAVEFKNVTFSYSDSEEPALSNITFTAEKGETIGIIGGTGAGKSTLVNLIPRFYQYQSGMIAVDGHEVSEYPFEQLRHKVGMVPQKAALFKGTVRENMQWRDKNASDEDICRALEIAQALDFVNGKPEKLDHMILQGGKNLSGGQRQRLTIARALVGEPEILVLDDSASALDLATDARLRKAISEKTKDMTVFIVSQRISSIRNADKIIVLDDGAIAGIGTHKQLFKDCNVYREICLSQLSAEEVAENEQ